MSGEPRFVPSSLNCTLCTAALSDAVADTAATPETVVPGVGATIDTVGGVVSAWEAPAASPEGCDVLPAASAAITR